MKSTSEAKIKKVAFIYLTQDSGEYYVTDDPGYNVQKRPQLGLQYLCATLERIGIKTAILDQTVSQFDLDWLIDELRSYDLAGFYCSDPQENKVKAYCKEINKAINVPILVGGPCTLTNSTFLDYGCDIVVHGEGEITIQQLIEYYNAERKLENIKGISYKKDGKIVRTSPQDLIEDLDKLPFPERSKIDINSYYDYFLFSMQKPYITMITSRGCIYRCSFCSSCRIWGYKYRRRSVDNVLSEIDEAVKRFNVKYISFQDDVFGITNDWIREFCKKLIKRPYKIRWMAILHPLSARIETEEILGLMKKAGCDTLSFGLQSTDPGVLRNISRDPCEPQQLKRTLKIANELKFLTAVGYIFGLPGDTKETIRATINYSLTCGSTLANYYMLSLLKGSEIWVTYKNKKICNLTNKEIGKLTVRASKKFYTRPETILKIAYFIIKSPGWFIKVGTNLPSILRRVGFFKMSNRNG